MDNRPLGLSNMLSSFQRSAKDLLLLCGVADADAGGGGVYCLNQGNYCRWRPRSLLLFIPQLCKRDYVLLFLVMSKTASNRIHQSSGL